MTIRHSSSGSDDDSYSDEEIERRMNAAVKRALNTPPKPHEDMKVGRASPRPRKPPQVGQTARTDSQPNESETTKGSRSEDR